MKEPLFLTLAEILEIHKNQIELYGGTAEVRDLGLLQSAISQPQMTFQNKYLHNDIYLQAAAYAFHISQNHPFADGNKRTALASALVFLELNGISLKDPKQKLLDAMLNIAEGKMDKEGFAKVLNSLAKK
ncbi:MAG: type II toxin-antitoxin system death-on-curing family toxin [Candidatus Omnitrophica bacterium]|nr:type II toxin-antitoxin system death-on-curing family toxin [Candidatus Omnitrophota bacterium]